jgi:hypothetical protein
MPFQNQYSPLNGAYILRLIRDGQAKSYSGLVRYFRDIKQIPLSISTLHRRINIIVSILVDAGLVQRKDNLLLLTPLVEKIQNALDVSLTYLSQLDTDSTLVNPIFGKPVSFISKINVFVLMPFSEELQPIYEDHIKNVCSELNLTAARADDFFAARLIISDIWSAIYHSQIIVADCTGRNPNVFYEIGIAHTLGRPTILISQSIEDVPFDLRHLRCIVYSYTPRGMALFGRMLYKTLETEMGQFGTTDA